MQPTRNAAVLVLCLGLVAALVLISTVFLTEVSARRGAARNIIRQQITQDTAWNGLGLAHTVSTQHYEALSANTGDGGNPLWRDAFAPNTFTANQDMPGLGTWSGPDNARVLNTINDSVDIWYAFFGLGSKRGYADTLSDARRDLKGRIPYYEYYTPNGTGAPVPMLTRWYHGPQYNPDFLPTTDPSQALYGTRFDVLVYATDNLLRPYPDFGAKEDQKLSSAPDLAERARYMKEYGRSLSSQFYSLAVSTAFNGIAGFPIFNTAAEADYASFTTLAAQGESVHSSASRTEIIGWGNPSDGGNYAIPAQLDITYDWFWDFPNGRYWVYYPWQRFHEDGGRSLADLWQGWGIKRRWNDNKIRSLKANTGRANTSLEWRTDDSYAQLYHHVVGHGSHYGTVLSPTQQAISIKAPGGIDDYMMVRAYSFGTFGSGLIDTKLDMGGVPWVVNPLACGPAQITRLICGLSSQIQQAATGAAWTQNVANFTAPIAASVPKTDKPWKVFFPTATTPSGGRLPAPNRVGHGRHSFELLYTPTEPTFSQTEPLRYLPPTPTATGSPTISNSENSYFYRNTGDQAAYFDPADAKDRFLNRYQFIDWLSWKHETLITNAVEELAANELDLPLTYEESTMYTRRPGLYNIGKEFAYSAGGFTVRPAAEQRRFDFSFKYKDRTSDDHYRTFPHTYPGPLWTGREGRVVGTNGINVAEDSCPLSSTAIKRILGGWTPLDHDEYKDNLWQDVAQALLTAIDEQREIYKDLASAPESVIQTIDQRFCSILGTYPGYPNNFSFDPNKLWNPAKNWDEATHGSMTRAELLALNDPGFTYLLEQYNAFFPVENPDRPVVDPLSVVPPVPRLGANYTELESMTEAEYHYNHQRTVLYANRLVNDVRMSLFGAGSPTVIGGGIGLEMAGRNGKPFSVTGRMLVQKQRFLRVLVRAQMYNLTVGDANLDLSQQLLDTILCLDPNEDGSTDDARVLYQRFMPIGPTWSGLN